MNGIISCTLGKLRSLVGRSIMVCRLFFLSTLVADVLCSAFPHHGSRHLSAPLRTCNSSPPSHQRVPDLPPSLQLPTLYFAVLMLAHVLDHFIFSSRLLTTKVKNIFFGVFAFLLLFSFWWFKGVAFGIEGPIAEYKGLQWRRVCLLSLFFFCVEWCLLFWVFLSSRGISITID